MLKLVSRKYLQGAAKRTETYCLKRFRHSTAWITILQMLNRCIVEVTDNDTMWIDTDKYNAIINEIKKKCEE